MSRRRKNTKDLELRLIAEFMKNSHRSDRELARTLKTSQPTVTRTRTRLEKEGIIKEYTIIPDFRKLGYEIMGITTLNVEEKPSMGFKEIRQATLEAEKARPHTGITIANGMGHNKNRVFIDFYRNYADYTEVIGYLKSLPFIKIESIDTFLVDLKDDSNLRVLSISEMAKHLSPTPT